MSAVLQGTIERFTYRATDSGWAVLRLTEEAPHPSNPRNTVFLCKRFVRTPETKKEQPLSSAQIARRSQVEHLFTNRLDGTIR